MQEEQEEVEQENEEEGIKLEEFYPESILIIKCKYLNLALELK